MSPSPRRPERPAPTEQHVNRLPYVDRLPRAFGVMTQGGFRVRIGTETRIAFPGEEVQLDPEALAGVLDLRGTHARIGPTRFTVIGRDHGSGNLSAVVTDPAG